jgi:N-acyl-D-glutamate deacylase
MNYLTSLKKFIPHFTQLLAAFLFFHLSSAQQTYDLVISNGRVLDPETKLDGVRNIGINGSSIAIVTNAPIKGRTNINAKGLVVAPGFIDMHAHGQTIASDRMQAFDGVTTALELESGILPIADWYNIQAKSGRVLNYGASAAWTFARIAELEGLKPVADLTWFQKAFSLNKWVSDPANAEQTVRIVQMIEEGIKDGAIGIGINAGYAPGGGYKELLAVHQLAAKYKIPCYTHISGDFPDDPNSAAEYVGQILSFAAATGSQEHICHINSSSLRDINTTKSMLLNAKKMGLPVSVEAYTYGASSTTIGAALFNEEARHRKKIQPSQIELNGMALDEEKFMNERKESPGSVIVFKFLDMPAEEKILDESVMFPGGAIASDAMPWVNKNTGAPIDENQWPLPPEAFAHPRSAGTFTRLLAHWVRERKALSLLEAVGKCSTIPAQILGKSVPQMKKKGRIQKGMDADIIIFDPATVRDNATFTAPNQTSTGMKYVFVNGKGVIENGELVLEARPGKAIRRKVSE